MAATNDFDQAIEDAKIEIIAKLDKFKEQMRTGTADAEHLITMAEIESAWSTLRHSTDTVYSDVVSSLLSSIDESEIIKGKKASSEERGSN